MQATPLRFRCNTGLWRDTQGNPIQAHGGGMLYHDGTYYWYGENKDGPTKPGGCDARVDAIGISCYSSTDLLNWQNEGGVLWAQHDDPHHHLHPSRIMERPKVVYEPGGKRFVMWLHIDAWDYSAGLAGVAVSDSPTGPFHYLGSTKPNGEDSRDMTLFIDDDGSGYLIHACEWNATTCITRLTDDYLRPSGAFVKIFQGRSMEAHAVCKHDGRYWLLASGCTGWDPNAARSAVADSVLGPWRELGNPCVGPGSTLTFGCQGTFLLPVPGSEGLVVAMFDRWNKQNLCKSGYVWLPATFDGERMTIPWRDNFAGLGPPAREVAPVAGKREPAGSTNACTPS